ncbi:MAG TPA: hypothetical protein VNA20_15660 [Frankiaceae bacterium]|nr:hypothetical protein [Frankiaceae bacterium]
MRRVSYAWALAAAACVAGAAELATPVTPGVPLAALLTVLVAQVPLPKPPEEPLTQRPPRSELDRHLDQRVRRARGGEGH